VEIFDTLFEAQVLMERWRNHHNTEKAELSQVGPHSSLGYRPRRRASPGLRASLHSALRPGLRRQAGSTTLQLAVLGENPCRDGVLALIWPDRWTCDNHRVYWRRGRKADECD